VRRIEALALAIAYQNRALEPGSEAFKTANPGLLKTYVQRNPSVITEDGTRIFDNFTVGLLALISALKLKCEGEARLDGLTPSSSLAELCKTFRYLQVRKVVEYLQDALDDHAVSEKTPLQYFLET